MNMVLYINKLQKLFLGVYHLNRVEGWDWGMFNKIYLCEFVHTNFFIAIFF